MRGEGCGMRGEGCGMRAGTKGRGAGAAAPPGALVQDPPPQRRALQPPWRGSLCCLPPLRAPVLSPLGATVPGDSSHLPEPRLRPRGLRGELCCTQKGLGAGAVLIPTPPCQPLGVLRIDAPTPEKSHCHHIPLWPLSQSG